MVLLILSPPPFFHTHTRALWFSLLSTHLGHLPGRNLKDLDLRLNPVTKSERGLRAVVIGWLPSLIRLGACVRSCVPLVRFADGSVVAFP